MTDTITETKSYTIDIDPSDKYQSVYEWFAKEVVAKLPPDTPLQHEVSSVYNSISGDIAIRIAWEETRQKTEFEIKNENNKRARELKKARAKIEELKAKYNL